MTIKNGSFETIAVIGAGQMGNGIAQVCATAGFRVMVVDTNPEQLEVGQQVILKHLNRQVEKGQVSPEDKELTLGRLTFHKSIPSRDVDLLIEAVSENLNLKISLLGHYDEFLKPEALIATNTSSLSITQLAFSTRRPDKVIGMHFMNPVPLMPLVEVIRGLATSEETFRSIESVVQKIGKTMVVSQDFPGFIVNRVLMPMINEAIFVLHEGIARAEDIDKAMKLGTNQPMGPLALADLIGLDTCLSILQVLYTGFSDSKYRPCPLLINYVHAGWLGRKAGRGFYEY
jgi:3-hydroxybutyryl-CoA dehydrogenase